MSDCNSLCRAYLQSGLFNPLGRKFAPSFFNLDPDRFLAALLGRDKRGPSTDEGGEGKDATAFGDDLLD